MDAALPRRRSRACATYLLKGGFVWIDDFWGVAEWDNLAEVFAQVFPNRPWQDIPAGHPILSLVFPLDGTAPGSGAGLRLPGP